MQRLTDPWRPLLGSALVLVLCGSAAGAGTIMICEGDTNPERYSMTDYHVTITAQGPITDLSGVLSDDGEFQDPDLQGEGTKKVWFDWFYVDAPPGDAIGFCIRFQEGTGSYGIEKSFTAVKGYVALAVPVLGATLYADGEYALTNAYDLPVSYTDFQYVVQPAGLEETAEELALLMEDVAAGGPLELDWTPLPDGVVPAAGEVILPLGLGAGDDGVLLTFVRTEFPEGPSCMSSTIQQLALQPDGVFDGAEIPIPITPTLPGDPP